MQNGFRITFCIFPTFFCGNKGCEAVPPQKNVPLDFVRTYKKSLLFIFRVSGFDKPCAQNQKVSDSERGLYGKMLLCAVFCRTVLSSQAENFDPFIDRP
jgi:hypothetical protein